MVHFIHISVTVHMHCKNYWSLWTLLSFWITRLSLDKSITCGRGQNKANKCDRCFHDDSMVGSPAEGSRWFVSSAEKWANSCILKKKKKIDKQTNKQKEFPQGYRLFSELSVTRRAALGPQWNNLARRQRILTYSLQ